MSDIEHSEDLAVLPNYDSIKAGMEIITENAIRLGRTISIDNKSRSGSSRILFVDSIHPLLNFCSSIYEIPVVSIITIGNNHIIIGGDVIPEIVETRVGIFRSLGLVDSLNTKIERRKPSYQRLATHNQSYYKRSTIEPDRSIHSPEATLCEQVDWANDGWVYNLNPIDRNDDFWGYNMDWNDDDLPGASVLRPKKPNPNLPPSLMLVDDDDDSPGETLRERF